MFKCRLRAVFGLLVVLSAALAAAKLVGSSPAEGGEVSGGEKGREEDPENIMLG